MGPSRAGLRSVVNVAADHVAPTVTRSPHRSVAVRDLFTWPEQTVLASATNGSVTRSQPNARRRTRPVRPPNGSLTWCARRAGRPVERRGAAGSVRVLSTGGVDGPPSSSGLGHHPFKVAARVRIPLGVHINTTGPVVKSGVHAGLSSRRSRVQVPSGPQRHRCARAQRQRAEVE